MSQAQPERQAVVAGRLVAGERVGDPLFLPAVDADQAERAAQFLQVPGAGGDDDQRAARGQDPGDLGGVARAEDAQHEPGRAVRQRQRPPRVRSDRRRPGVRAGGAPQRGRRQVGAQAGPLRQRVQDAGQVVPGAPGQVHHQGAGPGGAAGPGGVPRGRLREGPGDRPVVPAAQELLAGGDHSGAVAGSGSRPAGGEIDVALAGDVEAVPGRAAQGALGQGKPPGADRAAQAARDSGQRLASPRWRSGGGRVGGRGAHGRTAYWAWAAEPATERRCRSWGGSSRTGSPPGWPPAGRTSRRWR